MRRDGVVPLAVKGRWRQSNIGDLCIGYGFFCGIDVLIQLGADSQSRRRLSAPDELDDDRVTRKRSAAPVPGDVAEHAMLDLVPLARTRWEMAHRQSQTQVVRQLLQRHLPESRAAAVAAAAVRRDQQLLGPRISLATHLTPPPLNAGRRESSRVVI